MTPVQLLWVVSAAFEQVPALLHVLCELLPDKLQVPAVLQLLWVLLPETLQVPAEVQLLWVL